MRELKWNHQKNNWVYGNKRVVFSQKKFLGLKSLFLYQKPKEGIIGTTSKSALLSLISEGNKFPENYFWVTEKERLKFDEKEKMRSVTRGRAVLLLMGALVSRGLITTVI